MADAPRVLAVDGGGSGSRAALGEGDRTLARATAGPLQLTTMCREDVVATLDALADALLAPGEAPRGLAAVCVGAAGAVGQAQIEPVRAWAARRFPGARVRVVRDFDLVLALVPPPAIALIAGTGVAAVARDADGVEHVADGHGHLLGDRGGGFWIAAETLRRALKALDAGAQPPPVLDRLVAALGLQRRSELARLAPEDRVRRLAALVPVVVGAAQDGDALAAQVLAGAVEELAATVAGLRRRSGLPAAPLVLCGGLARAPRVGPALRARLGSRVQVVDDGLDGALRLARELLA
jgi:N-acetylglucosamine kinase-like BadF-type ATPase